MACLTRPSGLVEACGHHISCSVNWASPRRFDACQRGEAGSGLASRARLFVRDSVMYIARCVAMRRVGCGCARCMPVNGSDMTHTDEVPALVGLFGTDGR